MKKCRLLVFLLAFSLVAGIAGATEAPKSVPTGAAPPPVMLKTGPVHLQGATTLSSTRGLAEGADATGQPGLYIVQFKGPVRPADKAALAAAGAEVRDYLPENAFLVRMDAVAAARAQQLPPVLGVAPYLSKYKIDPALQGRQGPQKVRVITFDGKTRTAWAALSAQNARVLSGDRTSLIAEVAADKLKELATVTDIVYVEPVRPLQLRNDQAAGIIGVPEIWQSGLDGSGEVVAVADTGLDTGKPDSIHADFKGRIEAAMPWGRPGDASDPHGHGTHVAGSVVGTGAASGGKIKGMAPGAKLYFQAIGDSQGGLGGIPDDISRLFDQAYQAGARIHSNSWGVPFTQGGSVYDAQARSVDQFAWEHRNMTILFAAGNDGDHDRDGKPNYSTVTSPGTAKNAITVGATENTRPDRGKHADDAQEVAIFSSRGLTPDGRTKPDVVAPGTWILSTRSSRAPESTYWATQDSSYAYMGGTSMATPITAGVVALVRQHFKTRQKVEPAAALVKAALISGAGAAIGTAKDYGWGRIDLPATLGAKGMDFENEGVALETGQTQEYTYQVTAGAPLKLVLAWTDYPAASEASKALVNDLDLEVTDPSGRLLPGDGRQDGQAADRVNNVEVVTLKEPVTGAYKVKVKGYNVPHGPQPFAMVVTGQVSRGGASPPPTNPPPEQPKPPQDREPPAVKLTLPVAGSRVSGVVKLAAATSDAGGIDRVEFLVDQAVVGTAASEPYEIAWDSRQVANGLQQLSARAYDKSGNRGDAPPVRVTVENARPPRDPDARTETFTGVLSSLSAGSKVYFDGGRGQVRSSIVWNGWGDLNVTFLDPDGRAVQSAVVPDSRGRAPKADLVFTAATAGTHTILLRPRSGWGDYRLQVTHPHLAGTAETVRTGLASDQGVRILGYPMTVARPGAANVSLEWTGEADLDLYVVDGSGRVLARSTMPYLNPETVSLRLLAGTYSVYVVADTGRAQFNLRTVAPGMR